jgi:hypothetical protein
MFRIIISIAFFPLLLLSSCKRTEAKSKFKNRLGNISEMKRVPDNEIYRMIADGKSRLKDGDMVLRTDDDYVSSTLRNMSQYDNTFSHCGLAFKEDGDWYVYNNMAGAENIKEQMMRIKYDSFVSPREKSAYGIYRHAMSDSEIVKLHTITKNYFAQGLKDVLR